MNILELNSINLCVWTYYILLQKKYFVVNLFLNMSCIVNDQCSWFPYAISLDGKCSCIQGYIAEDSTYCVSSMMQIQYPQLYLYNPILSCINPIASCVYTVLSFVNPIITCIYLIRFIVQFNSFTVYSIVLIVSCLFRSK